MNDHTIKNAYPLPLISDLMDKLKGKKYFSKFDIRWGYNNVQICDRDQWKAAFKTKFGLYEPMVMFFGLCNSPATFQSMMDHIFVIQVGEGWIIIYMDDILVCDITRKGIKDKTRKVLEILKENDLYLKPEKCVFEATRIEYLGYVIEEGKIMMYPVKVKGIVDWPAPTALRQLRSFLGFCNYY